MESWEATLGSSPRLPRAGAGALPHPRALRQADGVGPRRSLDLSRYLWREGADADLEALRGVGPRTAASARRVLSSSGGAEVPFEEAESGPAGGPRDG